MEALLRNRPNTGQGQRQISHSYQRVLKTTPFYDMDILPLGELTMLGSREVGSPAPGEFPH